MKLTIFAATGGIGPNILDESLSGQAGRVRIVTAADLTAGDTALPASAVEGADAVLSGPGPRNPRPEGGIVMKIVLFVSLLLAGTAAGLQVAVLIVQTTLRSFDASVYTQVRQVELAKLDDLAAHPVPSLIAVSLLVIFAGRSRGRTFWLALTALILLAAVLATSLLVNDPINAQQLTWNVQTPPADWASVRDRWQIAHAVRTVAALVAFGCLGVAATGTSHITRQMVRA